MHARTLSPKALILRFAWFIVALWFIIPQSTSIPEAFHLDASQQATTTLTPPKCPAGRREQPHRTKRLWQQLKNTALGIRLLALSSPRTIRICYGKKQISVLRQDGVIYMNESLQWGEDTARLGHLLWHRISPIHVQPGKPCRAQIQTALQREAIALSIELQLRRRLGIGAPHHPFAFTHRYWALPLADREPMIFRQLWQHPQGARGIPALRSQYQRAAGCPDDI